MFGLEDKYQQLWKAIIRPPRADYNPDHMGKSQFSTRGLKVKRTDAEITNTRNLKLVCTHYEPLNRQRKDLPCVVYCHGNSGCRMDGCFLIPYVLCHDVSLLVFDFSGCGRSQGEYISLGYYERDDVDAMFKYLRGLGTVSSIGIWGRSMGAVTALMYADKNPEIACVVLDSPFSNLQTLCKQLADKYAQKLSVFSGFFLNFVEKTIRQKNNFNIAEIDPLGKHVSQAHIPAFFVHGKDDDFVVPKHTELLYAAYAGEKRIEIVKGDHNDPRPQELLDHVSTFLYYALNCKELCAADPSYTKSQKEFSKEEMSGEGDAIYKNEQNLMLRKFETLWLPEQEEEDQEIKLAIEASLKEAQLQKDKENQQK